MSCYAMECRFLDYVGFLCKLLEWYAMLWEIEIENLKYGIVWYIWMIVCAMKFEQTYPNKEQ